MNQEEIKIRLKAEKEAIQNCETIPIHDIGYIQPYGCLIAVDTKTQIIVNVSENISDWLNLSIDKVLRAKFEDIFSHAIVHQCNNSLAHSTIETQREHVGQIITKNKTSEAYAHVKEGRLIIELQPIRPSTKSKLSMLDGVHRIVARLNSITNVEDLLEQVVVEFRALSGFHRVKAYRFLSDGAGEISAESREPQINSFLNHRFPAADIPQSARRLYETTPIRIIPSISAEQVNIRSVDHQQKPLDLSLALFRGHVPVHMLYLKNMGVEATLSLPITVNGKMWGLFAFHHMEEKMLDTETLAALEILGGSISLLLNSIIYKQRIANIEECTRVAATLFVPDDSVLGFSSYWETASSELATLIPCDGVGLLSAERFDNYGLCPDEAVVRKLAVYLDDLFKTKDPSKPIGIDSIESKFPGINCGDIAGVLAIPNPAMSYQYLLYFRKDESKVIRWAGNPTKDLLKTEDGFRLTPRGSFTEYKESMKKTSDSFSAEELVIAESLQDALSRNLSTISIQSQHRQRLGLVIRELNHRVRNMLALIGSIITQSKASAHSIEDFVSTLEIRLLALSETQKLLTEYDWKHVNAKTLFEHALIPYQNHLGKRLLLSGNQVALPPSLASLLALIMNELASNAVKYGALSNERGKVDLTWNYHLGKLHIAWKEKGGPIVEKPTRHGFGTTLIQEALAYEFNADCSLNFAPEGVEGNFIIPVENNPLETENKIKPIEIKPVKINSFVALVLEDDYIIAKEMTSHLKSLGATKVDAAPTIESAKACIEKIDYDIAFLDVNIRGKFSLEIATLLEKKGVPFVFSTGFGSKDQELNNTACLEILSKPVSKAKLLSVLELVNLDVINE